MAAAGDLSGFEGHDVPAQAEGEAPGTPKVLFEELVPSSDAHALLTLSADLRIPETLAKAFLTSLQADHDTSVEDFWFLHFGGDRGGHGPHAERRLRSAYGPRTC